MTCEDGVSGAGPAIPGQPQERRECRQVSDTQARTAEQIEADIAAARARLASTVDELVDRAHPKNVAKRQVERAKAQVFDERGQLRTQKIVAVGGAAVGVVAVLLLIRRLVGRR
jgi:anti-sigma factor RsiW